MHIDKQGSIVTQTLGTLARTRGKIHEKNFISSRDKLIKRTETRQG